MKRDLIDYVFECSDFRFLSDLKYCEDMRLYEIIEKISPTDFPKEQWQELHEYLLGKETAEEDSQKIKRQLLQSL